MIKITTKFQAGKSFISHLNLMPALSSYSYFGSNSVVSHIDFKAPLYYMIVLLLYVCVKHPF